jgi:hypothetical protein
VTDEQHVHDDECGCHTETAQDPAANRPPDIPVEELLFFVLSELVHKAWIHLGIQINPATNDTTENLPQARLAIDGASALLPTLEQHFGAEPLRDVRNTVASLQLNYVQRVDKAKTPASEEPAAAQE